MTLFCALADLGQAGGVHGLDDEDEDIRVHVPSFDEAMHWLAAGRIQNSPAIIALQWLALNRSRLRAGG
jgi:ADP-ribose pyrophosphatase